ELAPAPAFGEAPHHRAPLGGPREVADALAGGDQAAKRPSGRERRLEALAHRDRRGLAEPAHALLELAATDHGDPLQRKSDRLQVGTLKAAAERSGTRCRGEARLAIAVQVQRKVGVREREPPVFDAVGLVVEEPVRAFEPAPRERELAPELPEVSGEPRG